MGVKELTMGVDGVDGLGGIHNSVCITLPLLDSVRPRY